MRYLIFGRHGQLAAAFIRRFESRSMDFLAPDEAQGDITNAAAVAGVIDSCRPDVIINCAAYNLVDRAEQERERAFLVNGEGPRLLAEAARKQGSLLVHFSSDYVFDGTKESGLYGEQDGVNPLNVYGLSKLEGEAAVRAATDRFLLFRLSWVFGEGKQNFISKLLEWSRSSEYLRIACDEFSVPTHTETVVDVTLEALQQGLIGLYHLTNTGFCSRYEWARLVLEQMGIKKFIRPVPMDVFQLPARRPKFSAMSNEAVSRLLGVRIPAWQDAVSAFLRGAGPVR
jgi:dTDP-4-dehydrorhamnose reductase